MRHTTRRVAAAPDVLWRHWWGCCSRCCLCQTFRQEAPKRNHACNPQRSSTTCHAPYHSGQGASCMPTQASHLLHQPSSVSPQDVRRSCRKHHKGGRAPRHNTWSSQHQHLDKTKSNTNTWARQRATPTHQECTAHLEPCIGQAQQLQAAHKQHPLAPGRRAQRPSSTHSTRRETSCTTGKAPHTHKTDRHTRKLGFAFSRV